MPSRPGRGGSSTRPSSSLLAAQAGHQAKWASAGHQEHQTARKKSTSRPCERPAHSVCDGTGGYSNERRVEAKSGGKKIWCKEITEESCEQVKSAAATLTSLLVN
uniref:Uncharacterized protein n=1 Tax=Setaria viridis TaxID=4556 RepID=A0A4U6US67_SETVI|nr:hypothetical protein SEVIR_5G417000v2 [Setaria viridis]